MKGFLDGFEGMHIRDVAALVRSRAVPVVDVMGMLRDLPHPARPPQAIVDIRRSLRRVTDCDNPQPHAPDKDPFLATLKRQPLGEKAKALRQYRWRKRPAFVASTVDWLDLHRYDRPVEAAHLARIAAVDLASEGYLETTLRALAVYASSVRMGGSMSLAGMVLIEAMRLANQVGPKFEAELIQRAGYIVQDHAKHAEAIKCFNMAGALYVLNEDYEGLAKVMVDRGLCFFLRGNVKAAEDELRRGLILLPREAKRYRSAAHLTLSVVLSSSGRKTEGLRQITSAEELLNRPTAYDQTSFAYTRAGLAWEQGRNCEAEVLYREAKALAHRFSPFESALITLDLLALLVEQGRREEATKEGRTVHALMHPLRLHPYAQRSLLELARLNGQMTLQDIATARQAVQTARKEGSFRAEIL
jgi:tetratricopeptide (TPR) repeat protein